MSSEKSGYSGYVRKERSSRAGGRKRGKFHQRKQQRTKRPSAQDLRMGMMSVCVARVTVVLRRNERNQKPGCEQGRGAWRRGTKSKCTTPTNEKRPLVGSLSKKHKKAKQQTGKRPARPLNKRKQSEEKEAKNREAADPTRKLSFVAHITFFLFLGSNPSLPPSPHLTPTTPSFPPLKPTHQNQNVGRAPSSRSPSSSTPSKSRRSVLVR